ncbi:glycosyl transferase family 2 [Nonlabens sp. YIK11]|uniref:glycosyltransferase n=1 Tax=Nonlabens sp. YIK11 TaxID=1453349 RepID=UPI0006DD1617|nr:glycosyltransferase [Nonlabens sp. YIK11]KQC32893.1 glycosyl transferase family 2 [Nonlabens sp. YIK11]
MAIGLFYVILLGCVLLNVCFYFYFSKVCFSNPATYDKNVTPVSVIVCAKNEEENLRRLVPQLLSQDHPNFEIILINDASSDDTRFVIEDFMAQHPQIKMVDVVNNETFWGNKKYALTLGIKKAVNDHLVFIDADCEPASNQWLSLISSPLKNDTTIVLGYSGYHKAKNSLLNALIRFETVLAAVQYLGYAMRGNPYMGVGRNLAYTSKQFYDVSGFMSHMKVMGGDDDLFVNEAATGNNTAVVIDSEAFTMSKPKQEWNKWWTQKKRHVQTSKLYKTRHKLSLGLFFTSQIFFFIATILGFFFGLQWEAILSLVLIRYVIVWIVMGKGLSRFRESELIPFFPLLELLLVFLQAGLFISNITHKPSRWK